MHSHVKRGNEKVSGDMERGDQYTRKKGRAKMKILKYLAIYLIIFLLGFVTAIVFTVVQHTLDPKKQVTVDIRNHASYKIKEIFIQATDGGGNYYNSVTYFNLKPKKKISIPIVFLRDGSIKITYTMDNNLTFESNHAYVMVGDIEKETITDTGVYTKEVD